MVLVQPLRALLQRDQAGRRHDPGLPPRAAEQDLQPPGLADVLRRAAEQRADRRAEALRDAEHHRVDLARVLRRRRRPAAAAALKIRAPSRWIGSAVLVGDLADRAELLDRHAPCRRRGRPCSPPRAGRRPRRRRDRRARRALARELGGHPALRPWIVPVRNVMPDRHAPTSSSRCWPRGRPPSAATRWPGPCTCSRSPIWLAMVPVGT